MRYYAISDIELRQFHMASLLAGGGDAVLPVINGIREHKISYAAESQKPADNGESAPCEVAESCPVHRCRECRRYYDDLYQLT